MSKNLAQIRRRIGYPQQDNNQSERFILAGGINIEEPVPNGDAGKLIYSLNFEPNFSGGYNSRGGIERVDGRRQPSAFSYQALRINAITVPSFKPNIVGSVITGATSGATAYFVGWRTVNGELLLIVAKTNPVFITADFKLSTDPAWADIIEFSSGESLKNGANVFGSLIGGGANPVAALDDISAVNDYVVSARTIATNLIKPVGDAACAGRALGTFDLNGVLYGIRNNAANTASLLFKASKTGWVAVPLGVILYFRNQTANIAEGDTLTNTAGTGSFVVRRITTMFGTVGSGDAAGFFTATAVTGVAFVIGDNYKKAGNVVATTPAAGALTVANSLPPDAIGSPTDYRFRRWNFSAAPNDARIYGVNGKGPAFEFDGTYFSPIITGIGIDISTFNTISALEKPTHIAAQADHLFLGYLGGALQHSGFEAPRSWTAVLGADTRQTGDDITNLVEDINGTLLIQTRTRNGILYGDVNENFQLRWVGTFGAYKNTAQRINGATFLTDEGVMFQGQSQDFGNFLSMSESQQINTLLRDMMRDGAGVLEANVSRDGSMYRLWFDGGRHLSFCVVGNELRGVTLCDVGITLTNFWSGPSTIATGGAGLPGERIFACTGAGYIVQDGVGGWFDGTAKAGYFQTQFYYGQQDFALTKRYRRLRVDVLGADAYTGLSFSAEYDDGAGYRTTEVQENVTRYLTGGAYQTFSTYDTSFYGPSGKNNIRKDLHNQGAAISVIASYASKISAPFTIQAIEIEYATRNRRGPR